MFSLSFPKEHIQYSKDQNNTKNSCYVWMNFGLWLDVQWKIRHISFASFILNLRILKLKKKNDRLYLWKINIKISIHEYQCINGVCLTELRHQVSSRYKISVYLCSECLKLQQSMPSYPFKNLLLFLFNLHFTLHAK